MSRGYLNHRYSDDLDFFVNNDTSFQAHVEKAVSAFVTAGFSIDFSESSSIYFTRLFLDRNKSGLNKNGLKIDFVNDIDVHLETLKAQMSITKQIRLGTFFLINIQLFTAFQ